MEPVTFSFTGASQQFVVPRGTTSVTVEACGAKGTSLESDRGGRGGYLKSVMTVTPGSTLYVYVGSSQGYNGGVSCMYAAGGGGTDLRTMDGGADGSLNVGSRIFVAGGGGGGRFSEYGGAGGGLVGQSGQSESQNGLNGSGGSQTAGGQPGSYTQDNHGSFCVTSATGTLWASGRCPPDPNPDKNVCAGFGGGGGYYGGASAEWCGGGGSSYTDSSRGTIVTNTQGADTCSGDGWLKIT